MNGSIESIMQECDRIAFNEFKHDIEASYSVRRAAEKLSGDHNIGKTATTASKIYTSGSSGNYGGESGRNSKGYETFGRILEYGNY